MKAIDAFKRRFDLINFNRFRFWLQLSFFGFFVYGGFVGIELGNSIPTFSCGYNSAGRAGLCYLMTLQHQMEWPWHKLASAAALTILTGFVAFLLWFVVLNKGWCGFACPLGTIQDWITSLRRLTGIRYSRYSSDQFNRLTYIKYLLLALMFLIPLGIGGGWFSHDMKLPFCAICPGRALIPAFAGNFTHFTVDFSTKAATVMTSLGMIVTGLFFVGCFVKKRFFCFFCPMSALHYLISKPALLTLRKDGDKCTRCGDCYRVCDLEIKAIADDVQNPHIMMDDCIMCLKCVAACPETGALKANFAGQTFFESTEAGFIKRMNPNQHVKD
ncbi:4Fe-4S ferredoxin [Methylomonas sp. LWB]|uniref:4Fe-4S binding protein n=1 Tax=Methylomonas sp. LWB TaxID=1905845 RepID=UPI0008DAEC4D|nr:4Fe-4S binding protein [Methylomonas sp. LWB]OHX36370.1 4Fe-4S ferredoxin [Methylomonas sp. LWB]